MTIRVHALLAASLLVGLPAVLPSQNLFSNGSFETGDLSGWTLAGSNCLEAVEFSSVAIEGDYEFFAGPADNSCTLSQELVTTLGTTYTFSFWLDAGPLDLDLGDSNSLSVEWGGTTLLALVNYTSNGYTQYSFGRLATSATTTVAFNIQNANSFWYLDDVRAEATDVVPEPATMTLLATGLLGMAVSRRRRNANH